MNTRSRSSSASVADLRRAALAAVLGVMLLFASFGLLHTPSFNGRQIVDTPLYQRYGDAMVDGQVPYRDFELEYPPAALPMFALPSLGPQAHFRTGFEVLVALLGAATVILVVLSLVRLQASTPHLLGATAVVGLAPLLLGTVVLTRFDAWPAFLTAAALAASLWGRPRFSLAILGLAAAAKVYPAVLVPVLALHAWRHHGTRRALQGLAAFAGIVIACMLPFAILAPERLADAFTEQAGRPLQLESLGSAFLLAGDQLGSYTARVVSTFGSQNLHGSLPDAVASAQTALQIAAVVGVWLLFALGRRSPAQLAAASAASVCAFVTFGKVLSPQFLIWLVPLVPLVGGGIGAAASGLLVLAMVLTHLWFPGRYWDLVGLEAGPGWLLLLRDLALVALTVVLAVATAPERARSRTG